jgi:hypothetical protein
MRSTIYRIVLFIVAGSLLARLPDIFLNNDMSISFYISLSLIFACTIFAIAWISKRYILFQIKGAESIFIIISILGIIMKFTNVPLSGSILTLGLGGMALYYFPFSLISLKELSVLQKKAYKLFFGAIFFLCILGILFRFQFWPGFNTIPLVGILGIAFALILSVRNKEKPIIYRSLTLGVLTLLIYIIPISVQLKLQHWSDPELARLKEAAYLHSGDVQYINALEDYLKKKKENESKSGA